MKERVLKTRIIYLYLFIPQKNQGSGIGLVLSRQIVMNHGGNLTISNRMESLGVIASIYLPATNSGQPTS